MADVGKLRIGNAMRMTYVMKRDVKYLNIRKSIHK